MKSTLLPHRHDGWLSPLGDPAETADLGSLQSATSQQHITAVHDVKSSVWHETPASEHGKAELVYYKTQSVTIPDDCGHDIRILTKHYKESQRIIVQARCGEDVRASSAIVSQAKSSGASSPRRVIGVK